MQGGKRDEIIGICAGVLSGAAYGTNALFGKPLMAKGVSVTDMLLVRYMLAVLLVIAIACLRNPRHANPLRIRWQQLPMMLLLGVLFALSSITLFQAYACIPSGVAATLVYLYPVFTAAILLCCGVVPGWKMIVAIVAACGGVAVLCLPGSSGDIQTKGVLLSIGSAFVYALYLILVGRSKRIADVSIQTITIYALLVGVVIFACMHWCEGQNTLVYCTSVVDWLNLLGLAIFPTTIAMVGLSVATRRIGATRAAVLGVFEPITTILFGILLFHEPFTLLTALGMLICLTAMLFIKQ